MPFTFDNFFQYEQIVDLFDDGIIYDNVKVLSGPNKDSEHEQMVINFSTGEVKFYHNSGQVEKTTTFSEFFGLTST